MSFPSDAVHVAGGKDDWEDLKKARMDCFDNASSNYLFNKGLWITPGNYSSEPLVVDWLSIF